MYSKLTGALFVALMLGASSLCHAARLLRQDPSTYTSVQGQTPYGIYAVADKAEAGAASFSKGIRYNGGDVVTAGDGVPGPRASAGTNMARGNIAARSGNTKAEANANQGIQVIAATSEGARAVSGSGVWHTADNGAVVSANTATFRPGTVANRGSVAFTDIAPQSAAVSGMGNGPVAAAWGAEVGAMARSQRDAPVRTHRDMFDH